LSNGDMNPEQMRQAIFDHFLSIDPAGDTAVSDAFSFAWQLGKIARQDNLPRQVAALSEEWRQHWLAGWDEEDRHRAGVGVADDSLLGGPKQAALAEELATELRPPPEYEGKPFHFLALDAAGIGHEPVRWYRYEQRWAFLGTHTTASPAELTAQGWRYLGPAEWPPNVAEVALARAVPFQVRYPAPRPVNLVDADLVAMPAGDYAALLRHRDEHRARIAELEIARQADCVLQRELLASGRRDAQRIAELEAEVSLLRGFAITRPFAATVAARAEVDPAFAEALTEEAQLGECGPKTPQHGALQVARLTLSARGDAAKAQIAAGMRQCAEQAAAKAMNADNFHRYNHIAAGVCSKHGWYSHTRGFSSCDKCEDEVGRTDLLGGFKPLVLDDPDAPDTPADRERVSKCMREVLPERMQPPRKGEFVTCENGHLVCEIVGDLLPGWDQPRIGAEQSWPGLGAWRANADKNGLCECGKPWFRYCEGLTCTGPALHIKGRGWV
jgi:hypothetical protein